MQKATKNRSLNLCIGKPNGEILDIPSKVVWLNGLELTYYLRSMGAETHVEKSKVGGREVECCAFIRE